MKEPDPLVAALRALSEQIYELRSEMGPETAKRLDHAAFGLEVLAHILNGKSPFVAFGAPGDWGYNTEIGKALLATLRAPSVEMLKLHALTLESATSK